MALLLCCWAVTAAAQNAYRIRLADGRVVEMAAEEYVGAVVAGEARVLQSPEARKAMAVAARTYAFRMQGRHKSEGFDFCVTTHCQRALIGETEAAAQQTAGEMLWRNGRPAQAVYSKDCGGVEDPYCRRRTTEWTWRVNFSDVARALTAEGLRCPAAVNRLTMVEKTSSGRAKTLRLSGPGGSELISASSLRFAVGRRLGWNLIRSDLYRVDGDRLIGRGQGNGEGLCQVGAEEMGAEGMNYRAMLRFYYPGTTVSRAASGFTWTRLGGERVAVLTTMPNRDGEVAAQAEKALRWAEDRLQRRVEGTVEVRIYPDVATFRDATGAAGWVAAQTRGLRIDLQPKAEAASTLRHEMLHVVLERRTSAGVPVWFREGLAEYLCGSNARGGQRSYQEETRRVRELVARYGETAVLSWTERGLPREVKYSSSSRPTVSSR